VPILLGLRRLRESKVMSQRELAAKAGVSPATIVRAERGEVIRFVTIRRLADALGVSPESLVAGEHGSLPL
jgi:transcriptional regulator with XRE-family HTH domain